MDRPTHIPKRLLIALVEGYRYAVSPWLGSSCRFEPSCSAYALQALELHGAVVGTALSAGRVLRCHPWCEGGRDDVPAAGALLLTRSIVTRSRRASSASLPISSAEKNFP